MRPISKLFSLSSKALGAVLPLALAGTLLAAGRQVLFVETAPRSVVKRGGVEAIPVRAELLPGYHVNSDKPSDEYLIPLSLKWTSDPLETVAIDFPEPEMETYSFSEKPLSVFTGDFDIITRFKVPASVKPGALTITGKLRYQACSDKLCLPPKTIPVTLDLEVQ
jgi:hypothetical protein